MSADVVGYSRLMAADEAGTFGQLKAHRRELIEPKTAEHHGRVVKLMGDGTLMEFSSVVDAINFAVEVQQAMVERNDGIPEDRKIRYRVGINLGEIIVDGEDIYGDGVNIAARLEGLAEPGGIFISGKVYEEVRNKLPTAFEDLGEQEVKNIPEPVRVYRWTDAAVDPMPNSAGTEEALALPDKPSIAVLAFTNMSGDAEQEYFSDGITEDIITELSRFRSLFVIARNSSFHYKGQSPKVRDVGRELGVQYVVEGSVRKAGNRVRVTAQLVEAASGNHIWAERYDRDLTDIFAVQDEITQMVVSNLAGGVEGATLERAKQKSTESLAAHDYVLRGDKDYWEHTEDGVVRSRRAYLKAIELDPDYARAHAGLALTYISDWGYLWGEDPDGDLDRAFECAQNAVALDDAENRAHLVLGCVQAFRRDYARGRASLERAVALNPNDAHVLAGLPYSFQLIGDCDAGIEMGEKALRLNPHRPSWYVIFLAEAYFTARRYEDAIATFESATDELPDTAVFLAASYAQFGEIDDARALMDDYLGSAGPEPWWLNVPDSTPAVNNDQTGLLRYMAYMYPYKNSDDLDHLLDGIRKAGLKD